MYQVRTLLLQPALSMKFLLWCLALCLLPCTASKLPLLPGKCFAHGMPQLGSVHNLTVRGESRCFVAQHPAFEAGQEPLPILFFFHGGGGNAANCGGIIDLDTHTPLYEVMLRQRFALVCPEARQYQKGDGPRPPLIGGGLWDLPDYVGNGTTGNLCAAAASGGSVDLEYMDAVVAALAKQPQLFDVSRRFYLGCSMGAAFSSLSAVCAHAKAPGAVSAWATHSTGISLRGQPALPGVPRTSPAWPIVPWNATAVGAPLKSCIFDNRDDQIRDPAGSGSTINVFDSSALLAAAWKQAGNDAEPHFSDVGGHCGFHSHKDILQCMDDGTHRLLNPVS